MYDRLRGASIHMLLDHCTPKQRRKKRVGERNLLAETIRHAWCLFGIRFYVVGLTLTLKISKKERQNSKRPPCRTSLERVPPVALNQ